MPPKAYYSELSAPCSTEQLLAGCDNAVARSVGVLTERASLPI
jgi:hypothetical protein